MHHWSSKLGRVGRSCQNMEATDSLGSITFTRKTQRSVDFEKSLVALLKIIYCTKSRKKHGSGLSLACTLWTVINYVVFRTIFETFRHVWQRLMAFIGPYPLGFQRSSHAKGGICRITSCIQKTENWKTYFTYIKILCTLQWPRGTILLRFFPPFFRASQITSASSLVTYDTQHIHPGMSLPWLSLPATICWALM